VAEADPNKTEFAHLRYAPFVVDLGPAVGNWGDLRMEGYLDGKQVIVKTLSGRGVDQKFALLPDDTRLNADAIKLDLEGPAEIIGDNPFALIGGTGAIWIRAKEEPGTVRLTATHPQLGAQQLRIEIAASSPEVV
jgi:beta-galactosidase